MHEEIAESMLDEILTHPGAAAVLADWRNRFKARDFDEQYVAQIGQTQHDPAYWPLEQVAAFLKVHTGLMAGLYARVEISVNAMPGPDADRVGNAAKLRGTHPLFCPELDMEQNGADCDGWLSWKTDISMNRSSSLGLITDCGTSPVNMGLLVEPGGVPLEVGTSKPSRTYMHLHMEGGVARWPYHSDRIGLLINVEHMQARARRPARKAA
ncbi:hypothetical protein [Streptomyces seoulensis]|nr:hypothetical protein [Streptomyces seoulensis]